MNSTWAAVFALACILAVGVASRAGVGIADVVPANDAGAATSLDDGFSPSVETTARLATVRVAGRNCDGRLLGPDSCWPKVW